MKKTKITAEMEQQVCAEYLSGLSRKEVAAMHGIDRQSVTNILKRNNHDRRHQASSLMSVYPLEYRSWDHMIQRCNNHNNDSYQNYGGRGIKVCDEWLVFNNFIADMGPRPTAKHTIDRIRNDGNYEKSNCKWSTRLEQNNNFSRNKRITYKGEVKTLSEWERHYELPRGTLSRRLGYGWSVEKAILVV